MKKSGKLTKQLEKPTFVHTFFPQFYLTLLGTPLPYFMQRFPSFGYNDMTSKANTNSYETDA